MAGGKVKINPSGSLSVVVRVRPYPAKKMTFPAGTRPEAIQKAVAAYKAKLRLSRKNEYGPKGLLKDDVARFLSRFKGKALADREIRLRFWVQAFGHRHRNHLTTGELQAALDAAIRERGWTGSTPKHYRNILSALYNGMNGKTGYNPAREIVLAPEPLPLPRGVPYERLEKILATMRPSATRARLAAMAYLGLRPSEIQRMQPEDLSPDGVLVRSTKGGRIRVVPVAGPGAQGVLQELKAFQAFGKKFSTSSVYKSWKLAQEKGDPGGSPIRPYDLRHSFGSRIYAATGDQYAVQNLLGHTTIKTTERYTLAAVPERLRLAVQAAFKCRDYRPDHNGECLNCDEPADAHP